jgi:hypothetical protein
VAKFFEGRQKFPPDTTLGDLVVDAASTATSQGIETVSITRVSTAELGEALQQTMRTMALFQSVEGFEYSIKPYSTIEEGLESVGMSMPE